MRIITDIQGNIKHQVLEGTQHHIENMLILRDCQWTPGLTRGTREAAPLCRHRTRGRELDFDGCVDHWNKDPTFKERIE